MVEKKSIMKQLKEFHKFIDDLKNIETKFDDEDKFLLLLITLPVSFDHFKDVTIYGKECIIVLKKSRQL